MFLHLVNGFVTSQVGGIWHLRELPRVSSRSQPRLANRETVCVQARLPVTLAIRQLPPEWLSMPPQRERQRSSPPSPSQTPRVESCAPEAKQPERSVTDFFQHRGDDHGPIPRRVLSQHQEHDLPGQSHPEESVVELRMGNGGRVVTSDPPFREVHRHNHDHALNPRD